MIGGVVGPVLLGAAWAIAPLAPLQESKSASADAKGRRSPITVVVAEGDPRVVKAALEVAEAAWVETRVLFGGGPTLREAPVEIHLHRKITEYEAECDRSTKGDYKSNLSFFVPETMSAHLVMQPPIRGEAALHFAPTSLTRCVVAEMAAQLARHATVPNAKAHPRWIVDGSTEWVEEKVLASLGERKGAGPSVSRSTDEAAVQKMARDDRLPALADLLHDRIGGLDDRGRHAVRSLFFRFLLDGRRAQAFRAFLVDVRGVGDGGDVVDRVAARLQARLAVPDWKGVEAEFRAWIAKLQPEWDESELALDVLGDEWRQCAYDGENAVAFRTAAAGPRSYAIEGKVTVYADRVERPQANLLLGRVEFDATHHRFLSVALVPGTSVTLLEFDGSRDKNDLWKELESVKLPGTAVGKPLAFRVECALEEGVTRVAVAVAGATVLTKTIARVLDGPWGVGAQAGSSCVWRDVKLVAAGAK
jgi:hypothetical protein